MDQSKRKRLQTVRFGKSASLNISDSTDEPYADNSLDDMNFTPPKKKPKCVSNSDDYNDIDVIDLNEQFDKIKGSEFTSEVLTNHTFGDTDDKSDIENDRVHAQSIKSTLHELFRNTVEILTRVSVIEESLIKNKILTTIKIDKDFDQREQFQSFAASYKLPFTSIEDVISFEEKLADGKFVKQAVSTCTNIYL